MIQPQNHHEQSNATSHQQVSGDSRSEATSVCGDNSSVLSGFSGVLVGPQGVLTPGSSTVTSTTSISTSKATIASKIANQMDPLSKRDSLIVKESSNLGPHPTPKLISNDNLETSATSVVTGKEW